MRRALSLSGRCARRIIFLTAFSGPPRYNRSQSGRTCPAKGAGYSCEDRDLSGRAFAGKFSGGLSSAACGGLFVRRAAGLLAHLRRGGDGRFVLADSSCPAAARCSEPFVPGRQRRCRMPDGLPLPGLARFCAPDRVVLSFESGTGRSSAAGFEPRSSSGRADQQLRGLLGGLPQPAGGMRRTGLSDPAAGAAGFRRAEGNRMLAAPAFSGRCGWSAACRPAGHRFSAAGPSERSGAGAGQLHQPARRFAGGCRRLSGRLFLPEPAPNRRPARPFG